MTTPIKSGPRRLRASDASSPSTQKAPYGRIAVPRMFTTASDKDVLETIDYVQRKAAINNADGSSVFEMPNVEVPASWSQLATDILVSKYFRKAGVPDTKHETSAADVVRRIGLAIRGAGDRLGGYFASHEDAKAFQDELEFMLINQYGAFNSPCWFNAGLKEAYGIAGEAAGNWYWDPDKFTTVEAIDSYTHPQISACFIMSIKDDLMDIGAAVQREMRLFKYGSGTGTNFSSIRGEGEQLSNGGTSSGLMSFLEIFDKAAGATKSGGTTRRAAKMVCLDVDHPEIVQFVEWKAKEEEKAIALIKAGIGSSDFNSEAWRTVSGQNSNNSVRVTDEFMSAVLSKGKWNTICRKTGKIAKTLEARDLMSKITRSAWRCADPGLQFDTTINKWHTCPNTAKIFASNPCCFVGDTLVDTSEGKIEFDRLEAMSTSGEKLPFAFSFDLSRDLPALRQIKKVWVAGETKRLVDVTTDRGITVRCTPEHKFLLRSGEYVEAQNLKHGARLRKIGRAVNTNRSGRHALYHRVTDAAPSGTVFQSRFMWEEVRGRIADGYDVHHKNDDPTDDRLSNFELREKSEHNIEHSAGEANPRFIDADDRTLVEVWEAIEAESRTVTVWRWNAHINKNGLKGMIPLARIENGIGRIRGIEWGEFANWIDAHRNLVNDRVVAVVAVELDAPVKVYDLEVEGTHNFGVTSKGSKGVHSIVVSNSEFMFLDDTSCNLASLNLTKFLKADGSFDIELYKHAIRVFFLAQEIIVDYASYPTKEIAQNSHDFRPLGLGYANLGTLLMLLGVPYDSTDGTNIAGAVTAIMTGEAYAMSAAIAASKSPFPGFAHNREPMLKVMSMHRDAAFALKENSPFQKRLLLAARAAWDLALETGKKFGYRNAQATVLAPTGTIGLLMDCDTTGVEPDFSLVKLKKLAGGGSFKIVNQSVPVALRRLGYTESQILNIITHAQGTQNFDDNSIPINRVTLGRKGLTNAEVNSAEFALKAAFALKDAFSSTTLGTGVYDRLKIDPKTPNFLLALGFSEEDVQHSGDTICGRMTVEGAPDLKPEHLPIFDCANRCGKGTRFIEPMGHIRMMAAAQPFLSGAISKTVNMPKESTVEDVEQMYVESWKLGLKAIALYRDGSKATQVLFSSTEEKTEKKVEEKRAIPTTTQLVDLKHIAVDARSGRKKLPYKRASWTFKARVGGQNIYFTAGEQADKSLGEVFIHMQKAGAAQRAMLDVFAQAVSIGLQHGVPLEKFVEKFTFTRFEPQGVVVGHPYIKTATSPIDFIFRVLGFEYLGRTDFLQVKPEEATSDAAPAATATPVAEPPKPARRPSTSSAQAASVMTDAPHCTNCGNVTVRNGTCYRCMNCGESLGCS